MKTIEIEKSLYTYLQSKAAPSGEAVSETLRRELKMAPPTVQIEIEDDVYAYILSKATSIGEPASEILTRELSLEPNPPAGNVIEFHIKQGTGNQPWNTANDTVTAKVGNILRIFNDDSISHRPHTNGAPFPHPASGIPPGGHADYVLQSPFGPNIYDHESGPTALFWLKVDSQ